MAILTAQLQSTALSAVGYDDVEQTMEITFTSGSSYTYSAVPLSIFEGLRDARSPGQYYHQNIKGIYS